MTEQERDRLMIAETLCARLCHDFAGPLGTVMGGLELMTGGQGVKAQALQLASDAAVAMGGRLRLMRAAWTGDCGPLDAAQLGALAAGLPARVRADLTGLQGGPFEPAVARVLLNLLLLGAEALPKGGTVALAGRPGSDVLATIAGARAAWPAELPAAMAAASPLDDPRTVQTPLVVLLARSAGLRLSVLMAPGGTDAAPPLLLAPS
jgi:histidine phosphotransferase ChpT